MNRLAAWTARALGTSLAFLLAVVVILVWAACGPVFNFSDTWQLIINTSTTILTFLAVFLIQNTQNRDMAVLNLKLDELIRVNQDASNRLLAIETKPDADLTALRAP